MSVLGIIYLILIWLAFVVVVAVGIAEEARTISPRNHVLISIFWPFCLVGLIPWAIYLVLRLTYRGLVYNDFDRKK